MIGRKKNGEAGAVPSGVTRAVDAAGAHDPNRDLGFGAVVSRESRQRLLNRNGSFNVVREGLGFWRSLSPYHFLLTASWPRFLGLVLVAYLGINALFGVAFLACGPNALIGIDHSAGALDLYLQDFFFSVQTFATIGYGATSPHSLIAHWLVTFESLAGLLSLTLVTGLVFSRFARPGACILFSDRAIVAPFRDGTAVMFRIANGRSNQLIQVEAKVILGRFREGGVEAGREFLPLKLEREKVEFFPLSWTLVHPIDADSPLWGLSRDQIEDASTELLIMIQAFDETFSQTVQARSSYTSNEMIWGARFANLFNPPMPDGTISIDVSKLNDTEPAELPPIRAALPEGE
ncbi:MAG TPA: ion channel [Thermoanaerobaculia bacterium]|jgi:inward rectifier potassium channel|nr:ion channel [Thermoanaerobaculia bacterium]